MKDGLPDICKCHPMCKYPFQETGACRQRDHHLKKSEELPKGESQEELWKEVVDSIAHYNYAHQVDYWNDVIQIISTSPYLESGGPVKYQALIEKLKQFHIMTVNERDALRKEVEGLKIENSKWAFELRRTQLERNEAAKECDELVKDNERLREALEALHDSCKMMQGFKGSTLYNQIEALLKSKS